MTDIILRADEAAIEESSGIFFRRIGELRFSTSSPAASLSSERPPGWTRPLAVAPSCGIVAFCDHEGRSYYTFTQFVHVR